MVALTHSIAISSMDGTPITVEVDVAQGLPGISVIGMGNKAIQEAAKRVRSALRHSDLALPARKYTVNLAPADLPKHGGHYDLAIAIGLLVSVGIVKQSEVDDCIFFGELSLTGAVKYSKGVVFAAEAVQEHTGRLYCAPEAHPEASLVSTATIYPATTLKEVFQHLKGIPVINKGIPLAVPAHHPPPLLNTITGQVQAKRALTITLAGHLRMLMIGPPGVGKSLLATASQHLLPPLGPTQYRQVLKLHSLADEPAPPLLRAPFRAPHHTVSSGQLLGGHRGRPGEISLAHHGILFLDELAEYKRSTLEALRQPLEQRYHRVNGTTWPADCTVLAAANPCPCGYFGDAVHACRCSDHQRRLYWSRFSAPLLDRFDIIIMMDRLNIEQQSSPISMHDTQHLTVMKCLNDYYFYTKNNKYSCSDNNKNALYPPQLSTDALKLLDRAVEQRGLSRRVRTSLITVARIIAGLAKRSTISEADIAEALQLRMTLPGSSG
jgi:magnesium chelatase family protein